MRAEEVIAILQQLMKEHGNMPVVIPAPKSVQSLPVSAVEFHPYHRFWGGISPNNIPTAIRGKVFLVR